MGADGFVFQIDRQLNAGMGKKVAVEFSVDLDRQQAVLERVTGKYIGDIGTDDRPETITP